MNNIDLVKFKMKVASFLRWRFLKPSVPKTVGSSVIFCTLGSKYGRKTFCLPQPNGRKLNVISAGAGQDISFDIELLNTFDSRVIILDPTPLAKKHVNEVLKHLGQKKAVEYSVSSKQQIDAYDLELIKSESLTFLPKALWNSNSLVKFYLPKDNARDISGSINAIQNYYKRSNKFIFVPTIQLNKVMSEQGLNEIDILKLDIEGATLEVLTDIFSKNIYPYQLLIDFDEMHFPSFKSKVRSKKLFKLILKNGYDLIHRDNCDFTFIYTLRHPVP